MAGMTEWLRNLPKAELHVHLEGSVTPETLCEIAPDLNLEEVHTRYRFDSFLGFLKAYGWVNGFFAGPREFALIARRLFEAQSAEGVRYAEVNLSVGVMLWRKLEARPLIEAVLDEGRRAAFPVRWIFDAVRQFPLEEGWEVARLAAEYRNQGVVAFGIGGDEQRGPAGLFREIFEFARKQGLRLAPHAGESAGPESVWAALEMGAARIGHGIRAIEDSRLVGHLAENGIPLEICISSNLATGVVPRIEEHPVRRLFDAGVPIVLNTDDPPMFGATLSGEYAIAQQVFGFTDAELGRLASDSFRFAFDTAGTNAGSNSKFS
jgi:adenosine deaminase/aminodeoxyfutalosine deaminase